MKEIKINTDTIQLDQFLKWADVVSSGGEAKALIKEGHIQVNNLPEQRRSRKLTIGDEIKVNEQVYRITQ
ncbi:MAG: RNA-binding S4 domain-containing protein [Clostridia bacterium]|nr:RNA-binding S4 domain-containing protein [Clostridia bacterium]